MKIACISDLHINLFNNHNERKYNLYLNFFQYFKQVCLENKVKIIIITGDLFDNKTETNTEGLINISEIITDLAQSFEIIILAGNHDRAYKELYNYNLTNIFKNQINITVVDKYFKIEKNNYVLHFLSYFDDEKICNYLKTINTTGTKKHILFSHFTVKHFTMNHYLKNNQVLQGINFDSILTEDKLQYFYKVFLGDLHHYQTGYRTTYISSPFQLRRGDEFGKHGFIIIDTKDNFNHSFIENPYTQKFYQGHLTKKNYKNIAKLQNHHIYLTVNDNICKNQLILYKHKLLEKNFSVDIKYKQQVKFERYVDETLFKQEKER